jgi:hypothetical protein
MVMRSVVLLLLLTGGCQSSGDMTPKPSQAQAINIVWRQVYGQTGDAPDVEWHHDAKLWDGVKGFTFAGWKILLCDDDQPPATFRFFETELAHELMHERTFERTGDVDAAHNRGSWGPYGLEGAAVSALESAGL